MRKSTTIFALTCINIVKIRIRQKKKKMEDDYPNKHFDFVD